MKGEVWSRPADLGAVSAPSEKKAPRVGKVPVQQTEGQGLPDPRATRAAQSALPGQQLEKAWGRGAARAWRRFAQDCDSCGRHG